VEITTIGDNYMFIVQCCVCKKVKQNDESWQHNSIPEKSRISHGYCPDCAKLAWSKLEEEANAEKKGR